MSELQVGEELGLTPKPRMNLRPLHTQEAEGTQYGWTVGDNTGQSVERCKEEVLISFGV